MTKRITNLRNVAAIVACLAVMTLPSCSKDNPATNPDNPGGQGGTTTQYFGIKQATIVYDFIGTTTVYFDDYGKKIRIAYALGNDYVDDYTYLMDEAANKAYKLDDKQKTYQVVPLTEVQDQRNAFVLNISDTNFAAAGYKKTTETIAGKSCSIYSATSNGTTVSVGGWGGIVFVMQTDGGDLIRATSFSETVPANMFTLPSDYTLQQ